MSEPLRIARVLSRLNLGGPARQVLASDPRLVERGHELHVFAGHPQPGEGDLFDELRGRGVHAVRVPGLARGLSLAGDLRAQGFLRRALTELAPDVVHTHASKAGVLGRRAARATRAARVHTFHGHVLEGYFSRTVSQGLVRVERRLARETDRVVAVSHATADDLVRLGIADESKLTVVPPGIELEALLGIELTAPPRAGTGACGAGSGRPTGCTWSGSWADWRRSSDPSGRSRFSFSWPNAGPSCSWSSSATGISAGCSSAGSRPCPRP